MTRELVLATLLLLAAPAGSWRPAPGLEGGRYAPTATLVKSERGTDTVLVAGGYRSDMEECQRTAQLYDFGNGPVHAHRLDGGGAQLPHGHAPRRRAHPDRGRLSHAARLARLGRAVQPGDRRLHGQPGLASVPRELYTSTRLPDGRVLLIGGFDTGIRSTLASAEIYDPTADRFTRTPGAMSITRFGHDALWVPALRRVLVVGGKQHDRSTGRDWKALPNAELFDPETGRFTSLPPMRHQRDRPTLSLLPDGRVLIAGGKDDESTEKPRAAELFDPARAGGPDSPFLPAASLNQDRFAHHAVTLRDGRVLLLGGWSDSLQATTAITEIYDPSTGAFRLTTDRNGKPVAMSASRLDAGALFLPAVNRALVVGGQRQDDGYRATALSRSRPRSCTTSEDEMEMSVVTTPP